MSEEKSKKSPSESFAEMMKNFGSAMAEIFNDPALKEKARDLGESATASAKAFAERFKDEEVKNKFKELGNTAKKFGESVSDYFKDEKESNRQAGGPEQENTGDPKKKQENEVTGTVELKTVAAAEKNTSGKVSSDKKEDDSRARNARITGYGFSIAWSIILIIFFNFFSRYIAYYEYSATTGSWDITPFITSGFYLWLPVLNASLIAAIVGNIILIINDSFYFENITNIVMHMFGIASVSTLLNLFPFDFSVVPYSNLNQILHPVLRIALIFIIVGLSIGVLVRFIRIIVKTARVS